MAADPYASDPFGANMLRAQQQYQQGQAAKANAPSVGLPVAGAAPAPVVAPPISAIQQRAEVGSPVANQRAAQLAQQGYNPAQGQFHQGTPSAGPAAGVWNPATGTYMTMPGRDKAGNVTLRPGEQGFQTSMQRVNLDPYAQRIAQVGDIQMQRGLQGATLAGMPQVQADQMRAAQIDRSGFNQQALQQNQLQAQGGQAIGQLQAAAAGQVPSAALMQQQQGIEQAQQAQMAMAASARGGADQRAAAMRQGQLAGSQMAMQGVGQASALRAQEMAQARGQLVGAIGQQQQLAQGQGMNQASVAQAQAQLGQQAGLANQAQGMQAQLANQQGYLGATGMDQGLIGMGAGLYQQGAQLGVSGTAFNNAQAQADFNQQMAMQDAQTAIYGIGQGVASQRYAADQASNAAMWGAGINAGGQVLGASMQAFAPRPAPATPGVLPNPYR